MSRRLWIVWLLVALAAFGVAADAAACTVCYGESDDGILLGAKNAALFLVGFTYLLLTGGVATFVVLRRRSLRAGSADDDDVSGGAG